MDLIYEGIDPKLNLIQEWIFFQKELDPDLDSIVKMDFMDG